MTEQITNLAQTTLSGNITASALTGTVASAVGFPAGGQYRVRIDNELMLVTAGAGTTGWTWTRGIEGTTASPHSSGATVTHVVTAKALLALPGSFIRPPFYATDAIAPTIADATYDGFGFMDILPSGKLVMTYRAAVNSGGEGTSGYVAMKTSTDQGATWSATQAVWTPPAGDDCGNIAGGVTPSGRLVLFWTQRDNAAMVADAGTYKAIRYAYSDDEGASFSAVQTLDATLLTGFNTYLAFGQLVELANGRLIMGWYGWTVTGGTYAVKAIFSDDDGQTWGNQVTVVTATSAIRYTEFSFAYLGGSRVLCLVRDETGPSYTSHFTQLDSSDNGATWTNRGSTSGSSSTTPSPPTLRSFKLRDGRRGIACYWVNRQQLKLKVIYAIAAEIYGNASNWLTGTEKDIRGAAVGATAGYIGVVHPFGDTRAYGYYYDGGNLGFFANPTVFAAGVGEMRLSNLGWATDNDFGTGKLVETMKRAILIPSTNPSSGVIRYTSAVDVPTWRNPSGSLKEMLVGDPMDAFAAPFDPMLIKAVGATAANRIVGCRVVIRKTGTISALWILVGVSSGNINGGVYDTNATAGRLYQTGTIACPAGAAWRSLGNPALAVNVGDQLDLVFVTDNATATFGQYFSSPMTAGAVPAWMPGSTWPGGLGATAKRAWGYDSGAFTLPATLTQANRDASNTNPTVIFCLIAEIT